MTTDISKSTGEERADSKASARDHTRLLSWFGFPKMPFTKYVWATKMYPARSQQDLMLSLRYCLEIKGIAVVFGAPGVGKSITLRRFKEELPASEYQAHYLWNTRISPTGFLRSLCRNLGLVPSTYLSDMFDAVSDYFSASEEQQRKHPVLILDDCDNLSNEVMEYLRLLMNFQMDSEDRFSLILCGTEALQAHLQHHANLSFRQRVTYTQTLRPFTLDDAKSYIRYHLERVEAPLELFSEGAVRTIFHLSRGFPRVINQIAVQALIQAAVQKKEKVDENLLKLHVVTNLLIEPVDEAKS